MGLMADLDEHTTLAPDDKVKTWDSSAVGNRDRWMALAKFALKSGTPVAGNLASWASATLIQDSGVPLTNIRQKGVAVWVRLTNSVPISIPHAVETTVTFDQERWDTDGFHSTSVNTGRIVAPVAGSYLISTNLTFAANGVGERVMILRFNGITQIAYTDRQEPGASGQCSLNLTTEYQFAVGDYMEVRVYQSSGGALNIAKQNNYSPEFMMALL